MLDVILVLITAPFALFATVFAFTVGRLVVSALVAATLEAVGAHP